MEGIWLGESERAFFKYDDLAPNRVLPKAIYPRRIYDDFKLKDFKYEEKKEGEIRLVSCDISGMNSSKNNNDASVFTIFRLVPSKNGLSYDKYVCYMESMDGGHAQTQAIRIRQLYEEFECDYIVIDTQSFGLGVYDQLCTNLYDREFDIEYEAFSCINDELMAQRCLIDGAEKVIYSIKANAQLNSDMHVNVRDNLKRKKLRLLIDENEAKQAMSSIKGFDKLDIDKQTDLLLPYIQISLLIQEMVNLERIETENNVIKLKEPSSKRKDRYSSLGYGMYVAKQLEAKLKPKKDTTFNPSKALRFRKPKTHY